MAKSLFVFGDSSNFLVLPMGVEPTTAILETAALTIELRKLGCDKSIEQPRETPELETASILVISMGRS